MKINDIDTIDDSNFKLNLYSIVKTMKDPVSTLTHLFAFIATIPLNIIFMYRAFEYGTAVDVIAFALFCISLMALYGASTVYHWMNISQSKQKILRKIDHMMIFVLIAGTYTPVCLIELKGTWGIFLLCMIWALALGGILLKAIWLEVPRWLSTAIYVIMGWSVILAFYPLTKAVPASGIALLVAGGITYTLGAIIYATKWIPIKNKWFGSHELFHLFVMGGSIFHIIFMFMYVEL